MALGANELLYIIIAILLPPLAVILKKGCKVELIINIVLCLLMWLPGIIHAIYVIVKG